MKIQILIITLLVASLAHSQTNSFPSPTGSPVIKLYHPSDGISASGYLEFNDVNSRMGYLGFGSAGNSNFHISNEAGGNFHFINGKVGIGTSNLASTLGMHESGSSSNYIRMTNSSTGEGSGNGTMYGIDTYHKATIWNYENTDMYFGTNNQRRMTINSSGNIGIGTTNLASTLALHKSGSVSNYLRITNTASGEGSGNGTLYGIDTYHKATIWNYENTEMYFGTNNQRRMTIGANGNIGIGTSSPSQQLEIESAKPVIRLKHTSDGTPANGWVEFYDTNSRMGYVGFGSSGNNNLHFNNEAGGNFHFVNGSVGVGTTDTFGYKLAVNGTIGATEVKVESTSAWPDFIFEKDYKLKPLKEVETFITENKHLPEIPSAAEVTENGINLGEMDAKLLQKIEELTLYLIEQNKKIEELQKEVSNLKAGK